MPAIEFFGYCLLASLLGVLVAAIFAFVPGLHVLNLIGFATIFYLVYASSVDPFYFITFMVGMLVGYAILFTVPTVYLSAPDESMLFLVMPAQKYLVFGKGHEAVILTGLGGLVGAFFVVIGMVFFEGALDTLLDIIMDHLFWIIGIVVAWLLMTEWPRDFQRKRTKLGRVLDGWKTLLFGYLTFGLATILGFIVFYKTTIPLQWSFQSLLAPLVGLFAVPFLLTNILSKFEIPKQHIAKSIDANFQEVAHGAASGCSAGFLGAMAPAITAGPAAMLAGHATAQKGDRAFILSMGANRVVYFVGAVMLFFLPLIHLRRKGTSIMINLFFTPETNLQFYIIAGTIAIAAGVAFIMLIYLSRGVCWLATRVKYQYVSVVVLVGIVAMVGAITGWQGLLIMSVACGIGMICPMFHTRRTQLLAFLLVPIWLNMAGIGPLWAEWLGLI